MSRGSLSLLLIRTVWPRRAIMTSVDDAGDLDRIEALAAAAGRVVAVSADPVCRRAAAGGRQAVPTGAGRPLAALLLQAAGRRAPQGPALAHAHPAVRGDRRTEQVPGTGPA